MSGEVWCVQHRGGWCATSDNKEFLEGQNNVPTACGYMVWLPMGIKFGEPDCPDCLKSLGHNRLAWIKLKQGVVDDAKMYGEP